MVRATLAPRRFASMGITTMLLTLARPTAITDLTGLQVESSSAPVRGMADTGVAAGGVTDAATTVVRAGAVMDAAVIMAGVAMPDAALVMLDVVMAETATRVVAPAASGAVRLAAGITEMAVADSTVVAAAASTAAAEDTGNSYQHSKYPTR